MKKQIKRSILLLASLFVVYYSYATGEASTYFQVFMPPNNELSSRDVSLIITAFYDSTSFEIIDDGADGDTDDSKTGMLMAGQSYVLYMRENGVNDDAPHSGESASKQDGDYYIINSNKLVFVSQSTKSDWQHDWVPATNKTSKGKRFIVYAPPTSSSNSDLNAFAYDDNTEITVKKISWAPQLVSGYTNVDMSSNDVVAQVNIGIGEDLIFTNTEGRDILETGETYLIESSKDITLQYGALWVNARDGGGYVPSQNGSSAGELFYFGVPFQSSQEQEIRIVSWDDNNPVKLEYYANGQWNSLDSWTLDYMKAGDWISYTGNQSSVFRVSCEAGKKVSVFEANWLETGSPGTSDIATMVSAENGSSAGSSFLVYMAPPGNENRVTNPLTGLKYTKATHAYIFARKDATVTVKDANTNGQTISETIEIEGGRYYDYFLDEDQWESIYNGDGNPSSGSQRPYILIESDQPVSVFNTNFNDNWMSYFGTSQTQDFKVETTTETSVSSPGDTLSISGTINLASDVEDASILITTGDGLSVVKSTFSDGANVHNGTITKNSNTGQTEINYNDLGTLDRTGTYSTETKVVVDSKYANNEPVTDNTVISVETVVTGTVDGEIQQASSSAGVVNVTSDLSKLNFSVAQNQNVTTALNNTWSVNFLDVNNDNFDDIFLPGYTNGEESRLFLNDQNGGFIEQDLSHLSLTKSMVSAAWSDYNNDGYIDVFIPVNIDQKGILLQHLSDGSFVKSQSNNEVFEEAYAHSAAWTDFDNDGFVDLFVADYMPTKFNKLYHNNGDGTFSEWFDAAVSSEASYSIGAAWCDYDLDGDNDLFLPVDKGGMNKLYNNNGNGEFTLVENSVLNEENSYSTGASWGDYDNDGDMDLYVTNASNKKNFLYNNQNDGTFIKVTDGDLVNDCGNSHGSAWGDIDNDGDLDLFVSNDQNQEKCLYVNNGNGTFTKNTNEYITNTDGNSFGVAFSDYDNDGDLDLYVANHDDEANFLYTNNGNTNNWLKVKLIGTSSNYTGIGTKVKAITGSGSARSVQYRELQSQSGSVGGSQGSYMLHFGFGSTATIDSLVITWPSGYVQVIENASTNQILTIEEDSYGTISGTVYHDENENGIQDNGETGIKGIKLAIQPQNIYVTTGNDGTYSVHVAQGNYTISQEKDDRWIQIAPANNESINVSISQMGENKEGNNFANIAVSELPDLTVDISSTAFRRGFTKTVQLHYHNQGAGTAEQVKLSLPYPANCVIKSANVSCTSVENGTYIWELGDLKADENGMIEITDSVGLDATIGEYISYTAEISSISLDYDEENNSSLFTDIVVGSIDPNDIIVNPLKEIGPDEWLNYTIRFQNVGNYYASRLVVIDTLPEGVDLNSLQALETSHNLNFSLNGRIAKWEANSIYLPDSLTDNAGSNGFVKFRIKPNDNLVNDDKIKNRASIQFDYNYFIQTNTVINTFVLPVTVSDIGVEITLYPNPAKEFVNVQIIRHIDTENDIWLAEIALYRFDGVKLMSYMPNEENTYCKVELPSSLQGVYMLEVKDNMGNRGQSVLIIKP